jgi:hypothetical protein
MLDRIKAMRLREEGTTVHVARATRPRRILFNCQFAWPFGHVEYSLASALRLRGHDVRVAICGAGLDYCEQETTHNRRPTCEVCVQRMLRRMDAFGLPYVLMSESLTDPDFDYAHRVSRQTELSQLEELVEAGVPVGKLAFYNQFHFFHGFPFEISGEKEEVFRKCVASAILLTRAAQRMFDEFRPDQMCTVNGKFVQWAPFVYAARQRNIPYCTWEDLRIRTASVTFASNGIGHEFPLDEVWQKELQRPFPEKARQTTREFFQLWAKGSLAPWPYYGDDAIHDPDQVMRLLNLRPGAPVVSLFPNLCWDSTSVGFESAFDNMYDWLAQVVQYARRRPDLDFVIRAHPGESKLPVEYQSTTPVGQFVRRHCAPVPANVRLLEGDSPVTSYALGEISKVVMTYTSTLGIEFALRSIRPWAAARAPYGRKGFTVDLASPQHMFDLLDRNQFDNRLTPEQVEFAERFAYMFRFRKIFSFPCLDDSGNFTPPSWRFFAAGGNEVMDRSCEAFLNQESFLDIDAQPA